MKRTATILSVILFLFSCADKNEISVVEHEYDLVFNDLATKWDEAMPLGNAILGSLVWQKGDNLRISLDRSDLWDLRHAEELTGEDFSFKWLYEHVIKGDYRPVQERFDVPYNKYPGPTKIPGAGLELPLEAMGEIEQIRLYRRQAVCEVKWKNGIRLTCFIHAEEPVGWFVLDNYHQKELPRLVAPVYGNGSPEKLEDQSMHNLNKLGYEQGVVEKTDENKWVYVQKGWGDFSYSSALKMKQTGDQVVGVWSITSSLVDDNAADMVDVAMEKGLPAYYKSHVGWWDTFYSKSSINIPDKTIERQYYDEVYKIGCIARSKAYPISLQAVWTADNGSLPPWKGDYHHDLNTQLSYWPFYTGNYLEEGYGYLYTLWKQKDVNKEYTKAYFGTDGLNVPGVCTLLGQPMGGWCQYSLGPTVSAWLGQHFYLHWKYSQDRDFLEERAYPYLKDVATYLEQFTIVENGVRKLSLSSSPEFNDNRIDAWFKEMTNFDRALTRFAFRAAAELAAELQLKDESAHWLSLEKELPAFDLDETGGLTIAEGFPYEQSHRHFSHLMAIHPLGLIDKSNGEADSKIIDSSIAALDKYGPDWWVGYSYSWAGNMKARAFDGEGAAKMLKDFAECFCLRNGFHVNGDQSKTGKSKFTYRPFTLEGNMAFASGVQEMLLQSHTGIIRIFPAIPGSWGDVSFDKLRAMGAFVISAERKEGNVSKVNILSEKGGALRLANPFKNGFLLNGNKKNDAKDGIIEINTAPGDRIILTPE
ncbi:MAG: hypothetical protein LBV74_03900 [Tannerella sp.]|jgi:alpha-L-fucosidase 2|nr:hypothetical protein [Tannerella sp.]